MFSVNKVTSVKILFSFLMFYSINGNAQQYASAMCPELKSVLERGDKAQKVATNEVKKHETSLREIDKSIANAKRQMTSECAKDSKSKKCSDLTNAVNNVYPSLRVSIVNSLAQAQRVLESANSDLKKYQQQYKAQNCHLPAPPPKIGDCRVFWNNGINFSTVNEQKRGTVRLDECTDFFNATKNKLKPSNPKMQIISCFKMKNSALGYIVTNSDPWSMDNKLKCP